MLLLAQFLYRLSFGMAAAMTVTSSRLVTGGYYRNNLYVLLGLSVPVALASWSGSVSEVLVPAWPATTAAAASYLGAAFWLYEKPRLGLAAIAVVGLAALIGSIVATPVAEKPLDAAWLCRLDAAASGLLLGVTMAAMLLGHWYLNAPGMKIEPLKRLTRLLGVVLVMRAGICGFGLFRQAELVGFDYVQWLMIALRWGAGIVGTAALGLMTASTLKIPNTQAATGLLYVAVITTFLGELVGQLLSAGGTYPL